MLCTLGNPRHGLRTVVHGVGCSILSQGHADSANAVLKDDLPGLVDGLKATVADVGDTATALKTFAQSALPQYRDLATEASKVIATIGAVADRIGRDPGRFLLGTQTPEYRN